MSLIYILSFRPKIKYFLDLETLFYCFHVHCINLYLKLLTFNLSRSNMYFPFTFEKLESLIVLCIFSLRQEYYNWKIRLFEQSPKTRTSRARIRAGIGITRSLRVSKGSRKISKSCRIDSNTSSASRAAICPRWIFRGWRASIIGQSRIMADRISIRLTWSSISSIDGWNQWISFSCCFVIDSYISSCRSWSMKEGIVFV